ncbi:uncharacterized protein FN964_003817 isoform 1-T1 [Alca torda]
MFLCLMGAKSPAMPVDFAGNAEESPHKMSYETRKDFGRKSQALHRDGRVTWLQGSIAGPLVSGCCGNLGHLRITISIQQCQRRISRHRETHLRKLTNRLG